MLIAWFIIILLLVAVVHILGLVFVVVCADTSTAVWIYIFFCLVNIPHIRVALLGIGSMVWRVIKVWRWGGLYGQTVIILIIYNRLLIIFIL